MFKSLLSVAVLCSALAPVSASAVDRCNTKFKFENRYPTAVTVDKFVSVRGNRGDYRESLGKSRRVNAGARTTTRKNRLKKVDDGQTAEFRLKVDVFNGGASFGLGSVVGTSSMGNISADRRQLFTRLGVLRRVRCQDNGMVSFVIRPLANTSANRSLLRRVFSSADWNNPTVLETANKVYFGIW